jgi:hypothetical protein
MELKIYEFEILEEEVVIEVEEVLYSAHDFTYMSRFYYDWLVSQREIVTGLGEAIGGGLHTFDVSELLYYISDFNNDGILDLAVMPNPNNHEYQNGVVLFTYNDGEVEPFFGGLYFDESGIPTDESVIFNRTMDVNFYDMEMLLFAGILNAYAEFVRSDFTEVDLELIGHSDLVRGAYNYRRGDGDRRGPERVMPTIVYAFCDINNDEMPELFVGNMIWDEVIIRAIYSIKNGVPAPVITDEVRGRIEIWTDIYGDYVLSIGTFRMNTLETAVFILDENGALCVLESVSRYERDDDPDFFFPIGYLRYRDNKSMDITEEEYNDFFTRFGVGTDAGRVELEWLHFVPLQE